MNILTIGSLTKRKRIWLCAKACNEMDNVEWTIIGDGPDKFTKQEIEKSQVNWIKSVPNVEPYYQKADIFVLPSYGEGFGMVFAEAAAHGVPFVCTMNPGPVEVIMKTGGGYPVVLGRWIGGWVYALVDGINYVHNNRDRFTSPEVLRKAQYLLSLERARREWDEVFHSFTPG